MAFQVKHVQVENKNQKKKETGFLYVGIVDRKTKIELETPPPPPTHYKYSR